MEQFETIRETNAKIGAEKAEAVVAMLEEVIEHLCLAAILEAVKEASEQNENPADDSDDDDDDEELEEYLRKLAITDLRVFLKENYPRTQTFRTRNWAGDEMETVYRKNGITVDYAIGWDYLEIFGLSDEEYRSLSDIINLSDVD